jgi:hypothetical protein
MRSKEKLTGDEPKMPNLGVGIKGSRNNSVLPLLAQLHKYSITLLLSEAGSGETLT